MSENILVIGAGRMGYGVIKNLLSKNYNVYVNDPSSMAVQKAVELGAIEIKALHEVSSSINYVFLSLPSPNVVKDTVLKIKNGATDNEFSVIDLSTNDPDTAKYAYHLLEKVGIKYLEAPVSGGPSGAEDGNLSIMVGGVQEHYLKVLPILEDIGSNIFYLGEIGSAALAKICNNIVVASTVAILSEVFILASEGGIDPQRLRNILEHSVGGSRTLEVFGDHMVTGEFSNPTFNLGLMNKDVGLFMEAIKQHDVTSLIGSTTYQIYNGAMKKEDCKNVDHTVVLRYLEMLNSKKVNRI